MASPVPDSKPQPWTKEEKELIVRLIPDLGKNYVAYMPFLPGRSYALIQSRVNFTLKIHASEILGNPDVSPWTEDELKLLDQLWPRFGMHFKYYVPFFQRRSYSSIRWRIISRPKVKVFEDEAVKAFEHDKMFLEVFEEAFPEEENETLPEESEKLDPFWPW
jgi:hypothetical protein